MAEAIIGREPELRMVSGFIEAAREGPAALVLFGDVGMGKTTVWREAVDRALIGSYRVLAASAAESEMKLPYVILGDLLGAATAVVLPRLPVSQGQALAAALLQSESASPPAEQRAVCVGAFSALRLLCESAPVLLAVDDCQWTDSPSTRALEFAIRRLQHESIGILLAIRGSDLGELPLALQKSLPSDRLWTLQLSPLDLASTDELLHIRLGVAFSRPMLSALYRTSAGNPYFTLEIGRYLLGRNLPLPLGEELPVPDTLRELVRERLAGFPRPVREVLRVIAALTQPTEQLVRAAFPDRDALPHYLERAIAAHLVERADDDRLRFSHPLIRSVVYSDAEPAQRRQLHRQLAQIVTDPEERARHLALGTDGVDEPVAAALEEAAARANARGAPDAAAALLDRACALTPTSAVEDVGRRTLKTADNLLRAGLTDAARQILESHIASSPPRGFRAQLLYRMAKLWMYGEDMARAQNLLEETLAECTDDQALRAAAERDLSHVFFQMGKLRSALAHGLASVALAEELGDRDLLVAALCSAAVADFNLGHGIRPEFMPRAMVIAGDRYIDPVEKHPGFHQPLFIQGVLLRWTDNLEKAREMLERYLRFATERHHEAIQIPALFQLGELECWAGNLSRTFSYAEELARAAEFSGLRMANLLGLILEGWVAAYQGRLKAAQTMAEEALDITQSGETRHRMRCLHVLGFASLSAGNLMDARAHLSRIRELRAAEELREPGVIRADGDEIEALIELGELQQARRLAEELEERGEALNRAWALAVSARSRALLAAATGDLQTALEHANRALQHHGALAQPFELARTLLAMGSIERRARQKRPARESLHEALDIFERVGAPLWANRVRKELDRVGGRAPTTHALTPTERQVADLVARGRTNREVAAQLFMSVKTVEANLSRTYQKLGVRSRTELAAQIGAARLPDSGGRSG